MPVISLVAGLGNPGHSYEMTRHNAGFWSLDALSRRWGLSWRKESRFSADLAEARVGHQRVRFIRPTSFMNESGNSVASIADYFDIPSEQVLVMHDELDLLPGTVRVKRAGGHGGHNGLRDIFSKLGSRDFVRLRIGIGHPGHSDDVTDWVLSKPPKEELNMIDRGIEQALDHFEALIAGNIETVMKSLHTPAGKAT